MEAFLFIGDQQPGFNQLTKAPAIAEPHSYLSSGLTHVTEFFSNPNPADSYAGPDSGDDYSPIPDEDVSPLYLGSAEWEDILRTSPWMDSEGPEEFIAESKSGIEEEWCVHDLVLDYVPPDLDSVLLGPHCVPSEPESHYVPHEPHDVPLKPESHCVPLKPESHYVPHEPHDVPLKPESHCVPLKPESHYVPHEPESHIVPLKTESHYVPHEPEYVTLEPDSVALKSDYDALELDSVALNRDYVSPDSSRSLTQSQWPSYHISHPAAASLRAEVPLVKDIRFKGFSKKKDKCWSEIRISKKIQQEKKRTIEKVWLGTFDTQVQAARAGDVGKYFFKRGTNKKYFDPRIEALLSTISKQLQAEALDALVVRVQHLAKYYGYHGTLP